MADPDRIRQACLYCVAFRGSIIVVKIGHRAVKTARQNRLISDIALLVNSGIIMILALKEIPKKDKQYVYPFTLCHVLEAVDIEDVKKVIELGKIPTVLLKKKNEEDDDEVADLAIQLNAKKLVYITHLQGVFNNQKQLIGELSVDEAERLIKSKIIKDGMGKKVQSSLKACRFGVERAHIINGEKGALFLELMTARGFGTMIYRGAYFDIRPVSIADMSEIFELLRIANLDICSNLQNLEADFKGFFVHTTDQSITGCMKLALIEKEQAVELSHFVISPEYNFSDISQRMISRSIEIAREVGAKKLVLRPNKNVCWLSFYPWFFKLGFKRMECKPGDFFSGGLGGVTDVFLLDL